MFGAIKLTKHIDVNSYKFPDTVLDLTEKDLIQFNWIGRNVIIIGVDMSLSVKIDNRKKDILILGKVSTQGLERTLIE